MAVTECGLKSMSDDLERCLSLVRFNQFFNFYCSSGVVCNLMSESKCSVCGGKNARSNK